MSLSEKRHVTRDGKRLMADPWLFRGAPALVAHRGDAQRYPENTWLALKAAMDAGAAFIEFDVQLSKDGIPFVIHDNNFLRTAGLDLSVFDAAMEQISRISVGEPVRFADQYLSEMPISLAALCSELNKRSNVHSFIEIKRESIEYFGLERVVKQLLKATSTLTAEHTIISFCDDAIALVQKLSSRSTGWVLRHWNEVSLQRIEKLAPEFVFCNYRKIPNGEGLPTGSANWVLYEIDDPAVAAHWRDRGADLIETMAVEPMLKALKGGR